MKKIMIDVLENVKDVMDFFEANSLSYTIEKEFLVDGRYGKELVTLAIEYSMEEGDRTLWINAISWDSDNLDGLTDYFEEVYFA